MARVRISIAFTLACAVVLTAATAGAQDQGEESALRRAKTAADAGDFGLALDAYAEHLQGLTTREYRDKKTFEWLLGAVPEGDEASRAALDKAARDRLPKPRAKNDPLLTWRLHHLLAVMAERQGSGEEARAQRLQAIAAYPEVTYAEPDKHGRLQHLYNEVALAQAETDPAAAEDYLIKSFSEDPRFVYVYLPPWEDLYRADPDASEAFRQRVLEAYDLKAEKNPDLRDTLVHYRRALSTKGE